MFLLLLFVVLTDAVVTVPPLEWASVPVSIKQENSFVECAFAVHESAARVQVLLVDRTNALRFHRGRRPQPLYATSYAHEGRFRVSVPNAGEYVLLVDNQLEGRKPVDVDVRINVTREAEVPVRTLSEEKRSAVVALSLLFFGAVVTFSARQFLRYSAEP